MNFSAHRIAMLAAFAVLAIPACAATAQADIAPQARPATDLSAQQVRPRPRIRVYRRSGASPYPRGGFWSPPWPGSGAVRICRDWYATEYRASGPVITPQMSCYWSRG